MKERKKDYWTSKSVAHARITRESRSQSRSTPSAVLEDTCTLSISSFPLSRHLGSRRNRCARSRWRSHIRPRRWPPAVRGRSARSRWELKMRDRVFLQGRVTAVAILFRSVLTAHALFHTNEDPMLVLMLNPPPLPWIGLNQWVPRQTFSLLLLEIKDNARYRTKKKERKKTTYWTKMPGTALQPPGSRVGCLKRVIKLQLVLNDWYSKIAKKSLCCFFLGGGGILPNKLLCQELTKVPIYVILTSKKQRKSKNGDRAYCGSA